jgi:hypothetical protein
MSIEGFPAARRAINTRDAAGEFRKAEREQHVFIPAARFRGPQLLHALTGYGPPHNTPPHEVIQGQ